MPVPTPVDIPKMTPEVKVWWLEALRSDRFRKGQGNLRAIDPNDGLTYHCCLGVLCEVAIEHGLDLDVQFASDKRTAYFQGEALLLPDEVVQWAGLSKNGPDVWFTDPAGHRQKMEVTVVNDSNDPEYDFDQIADLIEASL